MTIKADTEEVDTEVELEDEQELQDEATADDTESDADDGQQQEQDTQEDDGVVVTIGEGSPPEEEDENRAPPWVRELRKQYAETVRELRETKAELAALKAPKKVAVGEKPTLESCDFDSDRFEQEYEAWQARKRQVEAEETQQREAKEAADRAWQERLDNHRKLESELKVADLEDAKAAIEGVLSETQIGMVVHAADNSALLLYALGKNPAKAKELAAIKDPVKYAFAVAKLETQLKVTPRKAPPPPERPVRGNASAAGAVDDQLERLRAEAAKTGDMSKVLAYKAKLRAGK